MNNLYQCGATSACLTFAYCDVNTACCVFVMTGHVKLKVKVKWIYIAPSRETSRRSGSVTCNYTNACL